MMAYANDLSYDEIFVRPLMNFLEPGDVLFGISASGNSKNVIKAIDYANSKGNTTIGICGYDGGKLKEISTYSFHVESFDMQKVEDVHVILTHCIMQYFCNL